MHIFFMDSLPTYDSKIHCRHRRQPVTYTFTLKKGLTFKQKEHLVVHIFSVLCFRNICLLLLIFIMYPYSCYTCAIVYICKYCVCPHGLYGLLDVGIKVSIYLSIYIRYGWQKSCGIIKKPNDIVVTGLWIVFMYCISILHSFTKGRTLGFRLKYHSLTSSLQL